MKIDKLELEKVKFPEYNRRQIETGESQKKRSQKKKEVTKNMKKDWGGMELI